MNRRLPTAALALFIAACSSSSATDETWSPIERDKLDAAQQVQLDRAIAAKTTLVDSMMKELKASLAKDGPAGAIGICKDRAPIIAGEIGATQNVTIGRTSDKLRNPNNTGPAWTAALLADRPDQSRFSLSSSGRLGVTLPIVLQMPCLTCHGEPDTMIPEVRETLASQYPNDQAIGYAAEDLRGWFWIEVPR